MPEPKLIVLLDIDDTVVRSEKGEIRYNKPLIAALKLLQRHHPEVALVINTNWIAEYNLVSNAKGGVDRITVLQKLLEHDVSSSAVCVTGSPAYETKDSNSFGDYYEKVVRPRIQKLNNFIRGEKRKNQTALGGNIESAVKDEQEYQSFIADDRLQVKDGITEEQYNVLNRANPSLKGGKEHMIRHVIANVVTEDVHILVIDDKHEVIEIAKGLNNEDGLKGKIHSVKANMSDVTQGLDFFVDKLNKFLKAKGEGVEDLKVPQIDRNVSETYINELSDDLLVKSLTLLKNRIKELQGDKESEALDPISLERAIQAAAKDLQSIKELRATYNPSAGSNNGKLLSEYESTISEIKNYLEVEQINYKEICKLKNYIASADWQVATLNPRFLQPLVIGGKSVVIKEGDGTITHKRVTDTVCRQLSICDQKAGNDKDRTAQSEAWTKALQLTGKSNDSDFQQRNWYNILQVFELLGQKQAAANASSNLSTNRLISFFSRSPLPDTRSAESQQYYDRHATQDKFQDFRNELSGKDRSEELLVGDSDSIASDVDRHSENGKGAVLH